MYFAMGVLGIVSIAGGYYVIRYYMLEADLKSACREMEEIGQNPEDNRILLVAHANVYIYLYFSILLFKNKYHCIKKIKKIYCRRQRNGV